jgi:hypothetical protein
MERHPSFRVGARIFRIGARIFRVCALTLFFSL